MRKPPLWFIDGNAEGGDLAFEVTAGPLRADKRLRHRADGGSVAAKLKSMLMSWTGSGTVECSFSRKEAHNGTARGCLTPRMACCSQEVAGQRKGITQLRDQLSAERRDVTLGQGREDNTLFDGLDGKQTLADLFWGRSQLIIKHFMLGAWTGTDHLCRFAPFEVDHLDGIPGPIWVSITMSLYVVVARAPIAEIKVCRDSAWAGASNGFLFASDFNYGFHVSFTKEQLAEGEAYYNYQTGAAPVEDLFQDGACFTRTRTATSLPYLFLIRNIPHSDAGARTCMRRKISRYHTKGP